VIGNHYLEKHNLSPTKLITTIGSHRLLTVYT